MIKRTVLFRRSLTLAFASTRVHQQSVSLHIKRMCQLPIYFLLALKLPFFAQLSGSAAGACEHTSCIEQCWALPREGTGATPREGELLFLALRCPHLDLVLQIPVLPETPRGSLTFLWLCLHHRVSVYQLLLPRSLVASFRVTSSDADQLWCATLQGSPLLPKGLQPFRFMEVWVLALESTFFICSFKSSSCSIPVLATPVFFFIVLLLQLTIFFKLIILYIQFFLKKTNNFLVFWLCLDW